MGLSSLSESVARGGGESGVGDAGGETLFGVGDEREDTDSVTEQRSGESDSPEESPVWLASTAAKKPLSWSSPCWVDSAASWALSSFWGAPHKPMP